MNERIRKLALQVDLMRYPSDSINIKIEKLAELIVRECADIVDRAEPYKANDLILKHFGIEKFEDGE